MPALRQPRKSDITGVVLGQEFIDELVHSNNFPTLK
jgi:hypothetical protein